jgi:arginyl-tRNA synthetase
MNVWLTPLIPYKVALTEATHITLKNGLWLLGIKTPSAM